MPIDKPRVTIYTDGGADPNPGPGGWGVVLRHESSGATRELSGAELETTNNRMELTAAIQALEALKVPCDVTLYTDSEYLKRGITEWLPGWVQKGWLRAKGKPVENADLWQKLVQASARHDIRWEWVKGHAGNRLNERADQLATQAVRALLEGDAPDIPFEGVEVYLLVSARDRIGYWAALMRHNEDEGFFFEREDDVSSNRLDVIAAANALSMIAEGAHVRIYTLSDYLRNGATRWIEGWKRRGWTKKDGEPVANQDVWEWLDEEMQQRQVEWPDVDHENPPSVFEEVGTRAQEAFDELTSGDDLYAE